MKSADAVICWVIAFYGNLENAGCAGWVRRRGLRMPES